MAKYTIVSRRKKVSPTPAPVAEPVQEEVTLPDAGPENGDAAFRLYEEFFKGETSIPEAPATEEKPFAAEKSDLIDPDSVEPTVEFTLDDVRRTFEKEPETSSEQETPITENKDMKAFFSALFGEEAVKEPSPDLPTAPVPPIGAVAAEAVTGAAAVAADAMDKTVRVPEIPEGDEDVKVVSSDTIRVPSLETQKTPEVFDDVSRAAPATLASITDLVNETNAHSEKEEKKPENNEFSSTEDAESVTATFKKKRASLWRRFAALLVLFLAALALESATFRFALSLPLPEVLRPGRFGTVYLLIDLQLILFAAALAFPQIKNGAAALFTGRGDSDSLGFLALLTNAVHILILLFFFPTSTSYVLFGCIGILFALFNVLRSIFELGADTLALRTLSADGAKYAAVKTDEQSPELEAFSDYIGEVIPEVYSVSRTKFAEGFLRRTETPKRDTSFLIALPLTLLASVGIALWCYLGGGEGASLYALTAFSCGMMMGLSASGIFTATLPYFFASRRAAKTGVAILGEAAVKEACGAEIVSFDDNEVFLPKYVKVTSVRTYGNARIDRVLIYCAQIFRTVGGPLSYVFENSVSSLSVPGVVEILENNGDGICARIDGKELYLGGAAYMEAYEFPIEIDESDATYENTVGRIMYLAADGELAAKFYIKYAVSARFSAQLSALNRAGIYAVVKTCDPNVDAALLQKILGNPSRPIAVLKTGAAAKNAEPAESLDAPIAGNGKVSAILNGFLLCEGAKSRASFGTLTKLVSMLLGLFITFFLAGVRNQFLSPVLCLIYQGIWLLPVVIPALFDWPMPPRRAKKRR